MGLRFLFPVYLIDTVEVTVGDQTSDATMTKSKVFFFTNTKGIISQYALQLKDFSNQSERAHLFGFLEHIQEN